MRQRYNLPANYRPAEVLAFHRRDPLAGSEQVTGSGFRKGLVWNGQPAGLEVRFGKGLAEAELLVDGASATVGAG